MEELKLSLFDAVRIVRFPDGRSELATRYSETGRSHVRIGDVGVVIGKWLRNKLRVEALDAHGAIDWQDQFDVDQLERIPVTEGPYCRRRINEHWAWRLALNGTEFDAETYNEVLKFARKVMAFARRNVDILVDRLSATGYRFAAANPFVPPSNDVQHQLQELTALGVHVPIAMQAWLLEVGQLDLCGTHPDWPHSAYSGMFDDDSNREPWYTDPLVINLDLKSLIKSASDEPNSVEALEIAPDAVTKANISGGGPICIQCTQASFDSVLIGQHGSFTMHSYLKHAFAWGGFPGFDYISGAPVEMLRGLTVGLVRL